MRPGIRLENRATACESRELVVSTLTPENVERLAVHGFDERLRVCRPKIQQDAIEASAIDAASEKR